MYLQEGPMATKRICYHGWSFEARDLRIDVRHFTDSRHRCGLPPGHEGDCVCRECGDSPAAAPGWVG